METTIARQPTGDRAPRGPGFSLRTWVTARRGVWLVAAAAFGAEMAVSARYGYHRDELYFLAAGRHPSAGYVDQPALTPLLARLDRALTGNTLVGLRALGALGLAAMVALTGSMARLLGASGRAQVLAALATACCAEYLGGLHLFTTTTPDFVCWAVLLWLVVRLLISGNPRWWLAIGACAGIAFAAKWNIGFLLAGLGIGMLATPAARPLLRSRYLAIAVAATAVLAAPDLAWQAAHGWPNVPVFQRLHGEAGHNRLVYWPAQAIYTSIALVPLWIRGLAWSLRSPRLRPAGIAASFALLVQFALGGKPYYPGGVFTFLFAAGVLALPRITAVPFWRTCLAGAAAALVALPVLPVTALAHGPVLAINSDLGEQVAWPREVALVARVYASLPAAQRSRTALLAGNYGEAGAIDRYGAQFRLPQAFSGHNNFWFWGPPPARDTAVVAIGVDPAQLRREFRSVRLAGAWDNGLGVPDNEQGAQIYVATGLLVPWATAWPAFRHYA
jgi:Dolichyl-phosphate-mannose-protein mannosyltransferase